MSAAPLDHESQARGFPEAVRLAVRDLSGIYRYAGARVAARYLLAAVGQRDQLHRSKSLLSVDAAMPAGQYRFRPLRSGGPGVVVDTASDSGAGSVFSGAREMYCRRVYVAQRGFKIGPSDTVVDLGANIGLFTTLAAVYGKRVVAVEAQSGFLPFIEENLLRNGVRSKAVLHLGLVGGGSGVLSAAHPEASHWGDPPPRTDMAALIERYDLATIDFLKIDIEGSEFDLFGVGARSPGSLSWLKRVRRIAMEVHPPYGDPRKLVHLLTDQGFQAWMTTNSGRRAASLNEPTGFIFARRDR